MCAHTRAWVCECTTVCMPGVLTHPRVLSCEHVCALLFFHRHSFTACELHVSARVLLSSA